jgi:hypothetical protein
VVRYQRFGEHCYYHLQGQLLHGSQNVSFTSCLDTQTQPDRFTHRERDPSIHWIGGWAGLRASMDTGMKIFPTPAENRTLQPQLSSPQLIQLIENSSSLNSTHKHNPYKFYFTVLTIVLHNFICYSPNYLHT